MSLLINLLVALATLALCANCIVLPRTFSDHMNITNLHLSYYPSDSDSMSFTLLDPEPSNNATICTGAWPNGQAVGKSLACGRGYAASIRSFTSYDQLSLDLSNWFHAPSVGTPDVVHAFGTADVASPAITCSAPDRADGAVDCSQPLGTTILAHVYAYTAKKH